MEEILSPPYQAGDRSEHIRELKKDLTQLGFGNFPKNPSTVYGEVTAGVVKEFQKHYKFATTGVVTQRELDKIQEVINPPYQDGDRGLAIVDLKKNLSKLGISKFPKNPSIFNGSVTANVVKDFQKSFDLKQTGIANNDTLNKMEELFNSRYSKGQKGDHV